MTEKMRVRLYWADGRVEQLKGDVDAGTTHIVRPTPEGHRHFAFAEEIDDEGYAIFWEENEEQKSVH
jgi:hypothetical protein